MIESLALKGVVVAFDAMNTQKAVRPPRMVHEFPALYTSEEVFEEVNKDRGRIEKRRVSISPIKLELTEWSGVKTIVKVDYLFSIELFVILKIDTQV